MSDGMISKETLKFAKEKGFHANEGYAVWAAKDGKMVSEGITKVFQSVLQKWLRDPDRLIFVSVDRCTIGSDEWEFGYSIEYLPKEHHNDKRRAGSFKEIKSFQDNYPYSYSGAWHTYEEAMETGLQKALTLIP